MSRHTAESACAVIVDCSPLMSEALTIVNATKLSIERNWRNDRSGSFLHSWLHGVRDGDFLLYHIHGF